jgi:hypothetical protein
MSTYTYIIIIIIIIISFILFLKNVYLRKCYACISLIVYKLKLRVVTMLVTVALPNYS